jgi:hypothetical protein
MRFDLRRLRGAAAAAAWRELAAVKHLRQLAPQLLAARGGAFQRALGRLRLQFRLLDPPLCNVAPLPRLKRLQARAPAAPRGQPASRTAAPPRRRARARAHTHTHTHTHPMPDVGGRRAAGGGRQSYPVAGRQLRLQR